jgi:hypothetical protein
MTESLTGSNKFFPQLGMNPESLHKVVLYISLQDNICNPRMIMHIDFPTMLSHMWFTFHSLQCYSHLSSFNFVIPVPSR